MGDLFSEIELFIFDFFLEFFFGFLVAKFKLLNLRGNHLLERITAFFLHKRGISEGATWRWSTFCVLEMILYRVLSRLNKVSFWSLTLLEKILAFSEAT